MPRSIASTPCIEYRLLNQSEVKRQSFRTEHARDAWIDQYRDVDRITGYDKHKQPIWTRVATARVDYLVAFNLPVFVD